MIALMQHLVTTELSSELWVDENGNFDVKDPKLLN